ncbi:polyisoprenoid-binding protein [Oxalobacteraceae bacterium]|nr:polyisoprenoid-binding protein [Oxalobacteraceae bacterium]
MKKLFLLSLANLLLCGAAHAAPATYNIDPDHTFPSFEADHMGISVWRGKINKNSGTVTLDKEAGYGIVDIKIDLASIDFGQDALNKWAQGADLFDLAKYPQTTYRGKITGFMNGVPTVVNGELTLHGVTKPVSLKLNSFKCIPHPLNKRELCGADAFAVIQRDQFGLVAGKDYGFNMDVTLRIQIEALKAE